MLEWERLYNGSGVPVGFLKSKRPLTRKEREYCSRLVDGLISKRRLEEMANPKTQEKKNVFTSLCFVGGTIRKLKLQEESGFLLVEVTDNPKISKWIPCSIYKEQELLDRLGRYSEGDHIEIRGFVRSWSQKKNEDWLNAVDVRVTEIRSKAPERSSRRPDSGGNGSAPSGWDGSPSGNDEDIPF
jgi:hypothetical protein